MTRKAFLLKLRQQLVRRRDALRQTLAGDLRALSSANEAGVGDSLDDTLVWAENELYSQLAESESKELVQIEKALRRMRAGQFGQCEGCGKSITMPRLEALPYASACIRCARQVEERRERMAAGYPVEMDEDVEEHSNSELEIG